jgi:hypothetical protein
MEEAPQVSTIPVPLSAIRVETAISRYPVHRLARKGSIEIDIREQNQNGEVSIRWEVDYSKKHGQPGPLAYKLDTLLVNRRIEEAARPIPKLIKLGSLRDICRELDLTEGENVATIRKALRQNAFAGISAKTCYRQADGTEKTLEADFTRYSVIFTGEKLPDGRKADAVYIILNDIFLQVINGAMTRPLDYGYLRSLSPAPQRFYELLSYQMYAALKHDRPRAKLTYSNYCTYAPQTRYFDWEQARKQMAKVHAPHRQSGYIARVDYQQTVDSDGQPDWIMLYTPGLKARAEYRLFAKRGGPSLIEVEPMPIEPDFTGPDPAQLLLELEPPLVAELSKRAVTQTAAAELVRKYPADMIAAKMEIFDWLMDKQDKRVQKSPAGYLVKSITDDYTTPRGFISRAEQQRREERRQANEREALEERRRKQAEAARQRAEDQAIRAYWQSLTPHEQTELDARLDAEEGDAKLAMQTGPLRELGRRIRRDAHIRQLLQAQDHLRPVEA